MANKSAILSVKLVSDAKEFGKGFKTAESGLDKFQKKVSKLTLPATAVVGGLAVIGKKTADLASEAEQNFGAVDAIFKDHAKGVHDMSKNAAKDMGISSSSYEAYSATLGALLKNQGVSLKDLGGQTDSLIQTGADLASMFGGTTSDAVDSLSSAYKGQFDPLEKYGITITAASVKQKALEMGLIKGKEALTAQAKQAATTALIMEQSGDAQGNFAKEADTAAGSMQIFKAKMEDTGAELGKVLLPFIVSAAEKLSELADWVGRNTSTVQTFAAVLGGLAVSVIALNGALKLYQGALIAAKGAQAAFGAAKGIVTGTQNFISGFNNASAAASSFTGKLGTVGGAVKKSMLWIGNSTKALALNSAALVKNGVVAAAGAIKTAALATAKGVATAAQWLYNAALNANPLGIVILAVAALVAGIVWLATKTTFFQDTWKVMSAAITVAITAVTAWFKAAWLLVITAAKVAIEGFKQKVSAVINAVRVLWNAGFAYVKAVVLKAIAAVVGYVNRVKATAKAVIAFVRVAWNAGWNSIKAVVSRVIGGIVGTVNRIKATVRAVISTIKGVWRDGFNSMRDVVSRIVGSVTGAFDRVIGTIRGVIDWVGRLFSMGAPSWLSSIGGFFFGGTGAEVVHSFGVGAESGIGATGGFSGGSVARPTGGTSAPVVNNFNINVEGALDPVAVGRQIEKVLSKYNKTMGYRPASGAFS